MPQVPNFVFTINTYFELPFNLNFTTLIKLNTWMNKKSVLSECIAAIGLFYNIKVMISVDLSFVMFL